MSNLYLLKKSATADLLLDIWHDYLEEDLERKQSEFAESDRKWKEPIYAKLTEIVESEERERRSGCIFALLMLVFSYISPILLIPGGKGLLRESKKSRDARKTYSILEENNIRAALDMLKTDNLDLPKELMKPTEKLISLYDLIAFLRDVQSVVRQATEMLSQHPEKSEAFAHTYFLLQDKSSKSSTIFQNFFSAVESLNISTGDLSQRVIPFLSQGGYLDFSMQTYLDEWMNTYRRIHNLP
ncbi:MAG: hypothetical protein IKJ65_08920 [Clostridia bacterium]|nr:hypothetical protein [Clostridia bacterium]